MGDTSYTDALVRRYLAIHPGGADELAACSEEERAGMMRAWLGTFEGRRYALADQCERTALELADVLPDDAEELWHLARELRETPITGRIPPPRLT